VCLPRPSIKASGVLALWAKSLISLGSICAAALHQARSAAKKTMESSASQVSTHPFFRQGAGSWLLTEGSWGEGMGKGQAVQASPLHTKDVSKDLISPPPSRTKPHLRGPLVCPLSGHEAASHYVLRLEQKHGLIQLEAGTHVLSVGTLECDFMEKYVQPKPSARRLSGRLWTMCSPSGITLPKPWHKFDI
jgi:hypothetical protein